MKICIVTATQLEASPLLSVLKEQYTEYKPYHFIKGEKEVDLLITGVGITQTTYALTRYLQHTRPSICIQAGIAGTFADKLKIGEVCNVTTEYFADLGAEVSDGTFMDVFEMGLIDPSADPFRNGRLINPEAAKMTFLPHATGVTNSTVSGTRETINLLRERYQADVESMEGAAFFHVCIMEKVPFMEIRSISNLIEERNREKWDIPAALESLQQVLVSMIESFQGS